MRRRQPPHEPPHEPPHNWPSERDQPGQQEQSGRHLPITVTTSASREKWGDPLDERRQTELLKRLELWEQQGRTVPGLDKVITLAGYPPYPGPFTHETLTPADVFWLATRTLAGMDQGYAPAQAEAFLRQSLAKTTTDLLDDLLFVPWPDLSELHLAGASLVGNFQGVYLRGAHLEGVLTHGADFRRAKLEGAHLREAVLDQAHFEQAEMSDADLTGLHGRQAFLEGVDLIRSRLVGADLTGAQLTGADLSAADLTNANLADADLQRATLSGARLTQGKLYSAHLADANLREAHLEGAILQGADLRGATLIAASFDKTSRLNEARLNGASLDQTIFDAANLAVVDWSAVRMLGDDVRARRTRPGSPGSGTGSPGGARPTDRGSRRTAYEAAVRAHLQLAAVMRSQGMNEQADRFAYRAQVLQRRGYVTRFPRTVGTWLFSWVLFLVAGYGYRPGRSLVWYLTVIASFTFLYMQATTGWIPFGLPAASSFAPLTWYEALILSVSSFHGRGFFQPVQSLGDPVAALAAIEAVLGLFVEISFIATFTQRFIGK